MSAIEYIMQHKDVLNITEIARKAEIPSGTLRAVVAEKRSLSEAHTINLEAVVKELISGGDNE